METETTQLERLATWIRSHGVNAWLLGDLIVVESFGNTYGYRTAYYDAVRSERDARNVLGY